MSRSATEIEREIRLRLAGARLPARGAWHELRHLIESESDRPGYLRQNGRPVSDEQFAFRAGCPVDAIGPMLQELVDVGLVGHTSGCWHSPFLARIAAVRAAGARRVREHDRRKDDVRERALANTPANAPADAVLPTDPAPPGSPSLTLSPSTPPTTPPIPSESGDAAAAASDVRRRESAAAGGKPREPRRRGYSGAVLSETQNATRTAFRLWFCTVAWPQRSEGLVYGMDDRSADFAAELRILRCSFVSWDLGRAKQVAETYLDAPDFYLQNQGRPLSLLGRQINNWASQTVRRLNGKVNDGARRQPTVAARDGLEQPKRQLRSLVIGGTPAENGSDG